jgi:hypothetical protein
LPIAELQLPIAELQLSIAELQLPVAELQLPIAELQLPIAELQFPIAELHFVVFVTIQWNSPIGLHFHNRRSSTCGSIAIKTRRLKGGILNNSGNGLMG